MMEAAVAINYGDVYNKPWENPLVLAAQRDRMMTDAQIYEE